MGKAKRAKSKMDLGKNIGTPSTESLIKPSSARKKKAQSGNDGKNKKKSDSSKSKSDLSSKSKKKRVKSERALHRGTGSRGSEVLTLLKNESGDKEKGKENGKVKEKKKRKRAETSKDVKKS